VRFVVWELKVESARLTVVELWRCATVIFYLGWTYVGMIHFTWLWILLMVLECLGMSHLVCLRRQKHQVQLLQKLWSHFLMPFGLTNKILGICKGRRGKIEYPSCYLALWCHANQPYSGHWFGHAMSKCYQCATNELVVYQGMKEISLKNCTCCLVEDNCLDQK